MVAALIAVLTLSIATFSQYTKSTLTPPPPPPVSDAGKDDGDSIKMISRVRPTVQMSAEDFKPGEYPADLRNPSNIKTEAVYDPTSGMYVLHTKIGEKDIVTPFLMTAEQYHELVNKQEMYDYFHSQNQAIYEKKVKRLSIFLI